MNNFINDVGDNIIFFLQFICIVLLIFLISYLMEKKYIKTYDMSRNKILSIKKIALIGVFSAISSILMIFEIPVFFAPPFYKIDLSEVPVIILAFAYGPLVSMFVQFCKILLKLVFRSSTTAFVGELADFIIGASFILPLSSLYLLKKSKKMLLISSLIAIVSMTIFGSLFNAIYLIPKFAQMYGLNLESIIEMGKIINPSITSINTFIFYSVVPFNLLKGFIVSFIAIFIYKKIKKVL